MGASNGQISLRNTIKNTVNQHGISSIMHITSTSSSSSSSSDSNLSYQSKEIIIAVTVILGSLAIACLVAWCYYKRCASSKNQSSNADQNSSDIPIDLEGNGNKSGSGGHGNKIESLLVDASGKLTWQFISPQVSPRAGDASRSPRLDAFKKIFTRSTSASTSTAVDEDDASSPLVIPACLTQFEWSQVRVQQSANNGPSNNLVMERLAHGCTIRAKLDNADVQIKLVYSDKYLREAKSLVRSAAATLDAESKIAYKECMAKVLGVITGEIPESIASELKITESTVATAVIFKHEKGGSLHSLIHPLNGEKKNTLMREKLRLLVGVAKSLAELHSIGICHGNLHPRNILLSGEVHPEVRLSGLRPPGARVSIDSFEARYVSPQSFSLSTVAGVTAPAVTSTVSSKCDGDAATESKDAVAVQSSSIPLISVQVSKEADVYAFGVLAWEILAGDFPYADIPFKVLGVKLAQGTRPDLDKIPNDCPNEVVTMIANCWQTSKRTSAAECLSTLQYHYGLKSKTCIFDVYISYDSSNSACKFASKFIHRQLTKLGCEVCVNIKIKLESANVKARRVTEISRSKVLIVCINQSFQHDSTSMQELRDARKVVPPRPIIPVFIEEDYEEWISPELSELCQLDSASSVPFDIAGLLRDLRSERAAKARASKLFQSQKSEKSKSSAASSPEQEQALSPAMFADYEFDFDADLGDEEEAVDKDEDEEETPAELFIDELYNQVRVFEFFQPGTRSALSTSSKSAKSKKLRNDD